MSISLIRLIKTGVKKAGIPTMLDDIAATKEKIQAGYKAGTEVAKRTSSIYNHSNLYKKLISKIVAIKRNTPINKNDAGPLMGLIGTVSPVPLGTYIGYGIGKAYQKLPIEKIAKFFK